MAAAWALAFTQVEKSAPEGAGLLRLLAFCAPDAIPLGLLLQPRPGLTGRLPAMVTPMLAPLLDDELAVKDAVAVLRGYSLVHGPEHRDTLDARAGLAASPGRRGMRPGPATSSPRCCPSASVSRAASTRTP